MIEGATLENYLLEVRAGYHDGTGDLLQSAELKIEEQAVFDVVLSEEIKYRGAAEIVVKTVNADKPEKDYICGSYPVMIITIL